MRQMKWLERAEYMTKISECEEKVMKTVWECKEAPDLKTVMLAVNEKHNESWKPQTVSTFLQRLVAKEYLVGTREGRYVYYAPIISLEDYRREQLKNVIEFLYDGNVESLKKDLE